MDYMFLVYTDEERMAGSTEAEKMAGRKRAWAVLDDAVAKGVFRAANPLQPVATAVTARAQNGKVTLTDGPFAETKEVLGGFWIIDCKDASEARYWASRICQEGCGANSVEFRQIAALPARPDLAEPATSRQFVNA